MSLKSAAGEEFLKTLEIWLERQSEVLILIRYSRAAGNKNFEFHRSLASLLERLHELPPETCVTVFRTPQLQLRGVVDDEFISKCLSSLPVGSEYVVVDPAPSMFGRCSSSDFSAGVSHHELREDLEGRKGKPVAFGQYPRWQEDTSDVISGYVPAPNGELRRGVY